MEVPEQPKVHAHATIGPSGSTLESVNVQTRSTHDARNEAVAATFGGRTFTVVVWVSDRPSASQTISLIVYVPAAP
jgi:hypothetical protein